MPSQGQIVHWDYDKGYGFIRPDDLGADIFFHRTGLPDGGDGHDPSIGTHVSFDIGERKGKPMAQRILYTEKMAS